MMKKLLFVLLSILSPLYLLGQSITLTTVSNSDSWSPRSVVNSGADLVWEATNPQIGTITQNTNVPTFDFSANDGSPISISVTSADNFAGLTRFQVYSLEITAIDATAATQLDNFHVQNNDISTIDISTLSNLTFFRASTNNLSTLDISGNPILNRLEIGTNLLPTSELDDLLIELDSNGETDGILVISGNQGLSESVLTEYNSLVSKGWSIDVPAPGPPVIGVITITTTSNSNSWSPQSITNTGNAFTWEATNPLIGTLTQLANIPVFDFSANDGSPISITVTSNDDFIGLTRFQLYSRDVTAIDATAATQLDNFHVQNNDISSIDISTLSNLTFFRASTNNLSTLDISGNPLLNRLEVASNLISSTVLDNLVNALDAAGNTDGFLVISGNQGITTGAQPGYDNLIAKGWVIDVPAPGPPDIATMSIVTTSTSSTWSPQSVTNTGNAFVWEATNAVIGTLTQTANIPTFDFSANDGTPINITVTSNDGFSGLTRFQVYSRDITSIDATAATQLDNFHVQNNDISSIDISTLTNLTFFRASNNNISALDISNNSLLNRLEVNNNSIVSSELDALVNQLDAFGETDGILNISGNQGLTASAQPGYDNLVTKGWTIDVSAPGPPDIATMSIVTTSVSNTWSPQSVTNTGNAFVWEATNAVIGTLTQTANIPTFDFSGNDGTPIDITITSNDGFSGLTRFQIYSRDITSIDATAATQLDNFHIQNNDISSVDISTLSSVTFFRATDNDLTALDISNNPILTRLEVNNNAITSTQLDAIVNQLDAFGETDGILLISGNEGLTSSAQPAYDNLITKGWTIDVSAPAPPDFATMSIVTTSTSSTWSPQSVNNSGNALVWEATNPLIGTLTQTANIPTFDFSANDGSPIDITVTSNDGFSGLTRFQVYSRDITSIDATEATELDNFHIQNNDISTIDITTLTNLTFFRSTDNDLVTLDISNNSILNRLELANNNLTSSELDAIINQLDAFGELDGILTIAGNEDLTIAAQPGYDNLIAKGWTIDVSAPEPPVFNTITMTTTSVSNAWSPRTVTNAGNVLVWEATNPLIGTLTETANIPTFDFSANDGSPISITVTSDDAFSGLSRFQVYSLDITEIDATEATALTNFHIQNNDISTVDISTLVNISFFRANQNNLTVLDISNNPFLDRLELTDNSLTSATLDAIVNQLDTFGLLDGILTIANNEDLTLAAQPSYDNLIAKGWTIDVGPPTDDDIMISQYYSGFSANDKWIEVKSLSDEIIPAGTYYLALYDQDDIPSIATSAPTESIAIPEMAAGEVLLFRNPSAALPLAGNLGPATQIATAVCTFENGDDIILISTNNGTSAYANRQDIVGTVPGSSWGEDTALIKGGCGSEQPNVDYDPADWIRVNLNDVDEANPGRNIALGTQVVGPTEFDGSSWSNLPPDQSREVIITQSFTGAGQTIEACNLTINAGVDVVFDSNGATKNSIVLYGDLIINGSLTIGDTESLVTLDDDAALGTITKIEKSTELIDINDVTYWSSPVDGSVISTVFAGVQQSRIFELKPADVNPIYAGTEYEHWFVAEGTMSEGRGYAAPGSSVGVQTLTFTGVPNNGTFTRDLYYKGSPDVDDESDNFNFIGNPYPTAIDIQLFLLNNQIVNEIFLWTHATENPGGEYNPADYVTYNLSGGSTIDGVEKNIGSGQGFMTRSTGFGSVSFDSGIKLVDQNDQFFKSTGNKSKNSLEQEEVASRVWLSLTNESGTKDEILVAFNEKSTPEFDHQYDSYYVNYAKQINLYSQLGNQKMVIQGLGAYDVEKKVKLGISNKVDNSSLRIAISRSEGKLSSKRIYLVDHKVGIKHELSASDYVINREDKGEFPNRFTLEFDRVDGDLDDLVDVIDRDLFSITNEFDVMNVNSGKVINDIKVYDMLGRMIIHKAPNLKSFQLNTSTVRTGSLMIIEARMEDGTVKNTKSIKY